MTPDEALAKLTAGNAAFVAGNLTAQNAIGERRAEVARGQDPFALILTCADSRVVPEHVFDCGPGELFVCRVAGNILEPGTLGSFEYALVNFPSAAVLVVLGHKRCGAVTATVAAARNAVRAPGSIGAIVDAIGPAVHATSRGSLSEDDYIDAVVGKNAEMVAESLVARSTIVNDAVAARRLKVVPARYSLDTGKVELLL